METSTARTTTHPHTHPAGIEQAHTAEPEAPCSSLLTSKTERTCAGIRVNGERCRARASTGHDFCSFHRSDLKQAVQAGRVRGGLQRRYEFASREEAINHHLSLRLDSRGGIQAGLEHLLRLVFSEEIAPQYLGAVARVYAIALRNIERAELPDQTFAAYPAGLVANERFQGRNRVALAARETPRGPVKDAAYETFKELVEKAMADMPSWTADPSAQT